MRSMGAAAVFETAAETPPTVIRLSVTCPCVETNCGAVTDASLLSLMEAGDRVLKRNVAGLTYSRSRSRRAEGTRNVSKMPIRGLVKQELARGNRGHQARRQAPNDPIIHRPQTLRPIGDCDRGSEVGESESQRFSMARATFERIATTYGHAHDPDIFLARHLDFFAQTRLE